MNSATFVGIHFYPAQAKVANKFRPCTSLLLASLASFRVAFNGLVYYFSVLWVPILQQHKFPDDTIC